MPCQALYISRKSSDAGSSERENILATSRGNNPDIGITGLLMIRPGRYIQILEGPRDSVNTLLEFIAVDPRHRQMQVLRQAEAADRLFGKFAMAEARLDDAEAAALDARLDALLAEPDVAEAEKLVRDFARFALTSAAA